MGHCYVDFAFVFTLNTQGGLSGVVHVLQASH